jgi:hypothetical protein
MRRALFVLSFLFLSSSGLGPSTQSTPNELQGMRLKNNKGRGRKWKPRSNCGH